MPRHWATRITQRFTTGVKRPGSLHLLQTGQRIPRCQRQCRDLDRLDHGGLLSPSLQRRSVTLPGRSSLRSGLLQFRALWPKSVRRVRRGCWYRSSTRPGRYGFRVMRLFPTPAPKTTIPDTSDAGVARGLDSPHLLRRTHRRPPHAQPPNPRRADTATRSNRSTSARCAAVLRVLRGSRPAPMCVRPIRHPRSVCGGYPESRLLGPDGHTLNA